MILQLHTTKYVILNTWCSPNNPHGFESGKSALKSGEITATPLRDWGMAHEHNWCPSFQVSMQGVVQHGRNIMIILPTCVALPTKGVRVYLLRQIFN